MLSSIADYIESVENSDDIEENVVGGVDKNDNSVSHNTHLLRKLQDALTCSDSL